METNYSMYFVNKCHDHQICNRLYRVKRTTCLYYDENHFLSERIMTYVEKKYYGVI